MAFNFIPGQMSLELQQTNGFQKKLDMLCACKNAKEILSFVGRERLDPFFVIYRKLCNPECRPITGLAFQPDTGDMYVCQIQASCPRDLYYSRVGSGIRFIEEYGDQVPVKVSPWKRQQRKLIDLDNALAVNSMEEIDRIAKETFPYAYDCLVSGKQLYPVYVLMAPQLEQLIKAEYAFADYVGRFCRATEITAFNRVAKPGENLKEILQMPKAVYTALKNCDDILVWDEARKMSRLGRLDSYMLDRLKQGNFPGKKEMQNIDDILRFQYEGRQVFTYRSLENYLGRLDMYEAIPRNEALEILRDYLQMCGQIGAKPRTDSDSLKREHDVMARNLATRRNEQLAAKMNGKCEELRKFDYEEDVFFIRGIRDYDDLLDEARQQHNCVAGYASMIAKGLSLIYVMREKAHPEKSLITVELSSDGVIRQKYLACNQKIRNKAQNDFLHRWSKVVAARMAKAA